MKKFFMIAGVIMAMVMVVQPTYAAQKTFSISVTIAEFSMELLESDTLQPYMDWEITVPPGGAITMTAMDAVMVSLTGDLPTSIDILTSVDNQDGWIPMEPDPLVPLVDNEFILETVAVDVKPLDLMGLPGFIPITHDKQHVFNIDNNAGLPAAAAWLIYRFHAGPHYNTPATALDIKVEALPGM